MKTSGNVTKPVRSGATLWLCLGLCLWITVCGTVAAQPVVLEFSGEPPGGSFAQVIDRFNAEHEDIRIEIVPGSESQILTRMAGGTGPDLYRVTWGEFGSWMHRGLALDLTPLIERDREELHPDDIWPRALEPFQLNGRQYAMPYKNSGNLMYFNLDRAAEAGLPVPDSNWDWDEFFTYAGRMSVDRDNDGVMDVWGYLNPHEFPLAMAMIASEGGRFFEPDVPKFNVDTPAMHQAMQRIYDLVHLYRGAPGPNERPDVSKAWDNGDGGMIMKSANPTWFHQDFNVTVLPNPSGPAGRVMPGGPQPMAISPYTEHVEEAWTFLKWLESTDTQAWVSVELELFPPSRRSAIPYVENPILRIFGSELENLFVYTTVGHSTFSRAFREQLDAVLNDEQSIPAAAAEVQRQMDLALAEAWK